ncbi:LUD domain-containing protein [Ornithinimicrobium sp. Arc0846-15]|nr:LUD domain-containing protein [Ornithinimicrobium laminariae]
MSAARDEILGRVRAALAPSAKTERSRVISRSYRDVTAPADPVSLFVERVADYQATVRLVSAAGVADAIAAETEGMHCIVPVDLPWDLSNAEIDDFQSNDELDTFDAVVTGAQVGIAETGTIVLDHQGDQGRRAITLVPDRHICIIRTDQIVAGVPEAIAELNPQRAQTWISGPSATSDIELTRVEGVHGPRRLVVLVVY